MFKLLHASKDPEGVGLAATQVGLDRRLFIIDNGHNKQVFINPVILSSSTQMLSEKYANPKRRYLEGCLSVPRLWGFVDRPYSVTVEYQVPQFQISNLKFQIIRKTFSGTSSSYVQHEIDHLNGILFTDRILKQHGQIFKETPRGLELYDQV